MDVFLTTDVEVWCDGWRDIDQKFPRAFEQYVYGSTAAGAYGLPFQLKLLQEHGLLGVFFVEPLFSFRFGQPALQDIVGLLNAGQQEIQLHLHTEWVDESRSPLLLGVTGKRQFLRQFSLAEQLQLISLARQRLLDAGAAPVNCFRAGSFGFNRDTLLVLKELGIAYDSSYNATQFGPDSGVRPGELMFDPFMAEGVVEYPMSVYDDGIRGLRHVQLTACSSSEMEGLLWAGLESGRKSMVFLSHNFELLTPDKTRADKTMVRRFERLCNFLAKNVNLFQVRGFHGLEAKIDPPWPAPLASPGWKTAARMVSQLGRRVFQ